MGGGRSAEAENKGKVVGYVGFTQAIIIIIIIIIIIQCNRHCRGGPVARSDVCVFWEEVRSGEHRIITGVDIHYYYTTTVIIYVILIIIILILIQIIIIIIIIIIIKMAITTTTMIIDIV